MLELLAFASVILALSIILYVARARPALEVDPEIRGAHRRERIARRADERANVLVLSARRKLVDELAVGLASYAVELIQRVDVADVSALREPQPDAIIVDVEGTGTNGFIVHKHVMAERDLVDAVHVIVSSDENASAIFAQHEKLRSRADAYFEAEAGVGPIIEALVAAVPLSKKRR